MTLDVTDPDGITTSCKQRGFLGFHLEMNALESYLTQLDFEWVEINFYFINVLGFRGLLLAHIGYPSGL